MISNLEKYREDLDLLISEGGMLMNAIQLECYPEKFKKRARENLKEKCAEFIKKIPSFKDKYQIWYSESYAIIKILLSDRLNDFIRLYEKPKGRKCVEYGNYVIEDYLQGLRVTKSFTSEEVVGPDAAIPQFVQQLRILESVKKRFESSLFDIKQLLQADLFDSELEIAVELNKKGFVRGAGAIAGVVLEKHLAQICANHKIKMGAKKLTINDLNNLLKENGVIEIPDWRFIQHLADLRNLCDHDKNKEPEKIQIEDLITGVTKVTKTIS